MAAMTSASDEKLFLQLGPAKDSISTPVLLSEENTSLYCTIGSTASLSRFGCQCNIPLLQMSYFLRLKLILHIRYKQTDETPHTTFGRMVVSITYIMPSIR